jgi:hypothetical protein
MANTSIQKLYESGKRAQTALQNMRKRERENTNELVSRVGCAVAVLAGGALAGSIDGKWGHDGKPTTEHDGIASIGPVPINVALGITSLVVGVSGFVPGSEYLASLGASLIAYPIGKTVEAHMLANASK